MFDISPRLESPNRAVGYTKSIYHPHFQGERGPVDGRQVAGALVFQFTSASPGVYVAGLIFSVD